MIGPENIEINSKILSSDDKTKMIITNIKINNIKFKSL